MPSPFPGVDPFLESQHYWPDFHLTFIGEWRDAVNTSLPANYEARFEEHMEIVELDPDDPRLTRPDIAVFHLGSDKGIEPQVSSQGAIATAEPALLPIPMVEEVHHRWIEILRRPDRQVVAVLEFLSPSNKAGSRGQYLAKRASLHTQNVHLVEVDMLISGARLPMGRPLPHGDFYAIISRAERRPTAEVYSWKLRDALPTIPVPLLKPDGDVFIDLGVVYKRAFERGLYARSIKYHNELDLPLDDSTLQWAHQTARQAIKQA